MNLGYRLGLQPGVILTPCTRTLAMSEENHELMIQAATFLQTLLVSEILAAH